MEKTGRFRRWFRGERWGRRAIYGDSQGLVSAFRGKDLPGPGVGGRPEVPRRWRAGIGTSPGQYGFERGIGISPGHCGFGRFEVPEVFEGAVDGGAGSVEALLEAGERLIAGLEGLGGCVIGVRPPGFLGGEFPEVGIGTAEAAKGPLAEDEVVEEEASLRGSGAVVVVILGFEPIETPDVRLAAKGILPETALDVSIQ